MFGPGSKRSLIAICIGVVLVNVAMVGASAAATLVAADALGARWSGVPNAAHVLGTAMGALGLAMAMSRGGRRLGLMLGYAVAAIGELCASAGVIAGLMGLLVVGMLLLGISNAAAQLARYAAAELFPVERRGVVVGGVVWGGTVGAIIGPNVLAPTAGLVAERGLPGMLGAYAIAALALLGAFASASFVGRAAAQPQRIVATRVVDWQLLGQRAVMLPMVAMVAANFCMVAVMTMTPLYMQLHGLGLPVVGGIISAHMVGMFALSPLTGRLADRRGGELVVRFGVAALVGAASLCAVAPASSAAFLSLAVLLLGVGWNLCWVGGSSLLARDLPEPVQVQVQGTIDAVVWGTSTLASLASGALLATGGFAFLSVVGALVVLAPIIVTLALHTRTSRDALRDASCGNWVHAETQNMCSVQP